MTNAILRRISTGTPAPAMALADGDQLRRLRDAFLRMTAGLKCRPGGRRVRWYADRCADGTFDPTKAIIATGDAALDAGQSLENVLAVVDEMETHFIERAAARDGVAVDSAIVPLLKRETRAEGAANCAEDEVKTDPDSAPALDALITETEAHVSLLRRVILSARRRYAAVRTRRVVSR